MSSSAVETNIPFAEPICVPSICRDSLPQSTLDPSSTDAMRNLVTKRWDASKIEIIGRFQLLYDNAVNVHTFSARLVTRLIKIPKESAGFVVGRRAANIRRIERETKTFIQVLQDDNCRRRCTKFHHRNKLDTNTEENCSTSESIVPEQKSEYTYIEIRAENTERIRLARLAIYGCVADMEIPKETIHMFLPSNILGLIIGKNGATLRNIQRTFKVNLEVERSESESNLRKVSITGPRDNVDLARDRINFLISRGHSYGSEDIFFEQKNQETEYLRMQPEISEDEW